MCTRGIAWHHGVDYGTLMTDMEEIIGHETIRAMLTRAIAHERLAHAIIFSGPAHVGKTTVAEWLSRAVLCERPTQTRFPCDRCGACTSCLHGTHPDVIMAGIPAEAKEISVEVVRGLRSSLERSAFMQGYQVAVIRDADAMTVEAANSLLKILEEPRGKTLIVLLATNAYRLLPTIRSRAVTIRFAPVPEATIASACRAWGASAEDAATIVALAGGKVGLARQLVEDERMRATAADTLNGFLGVLEESGWTSRRQRVEMVIDAWKSADVLVLMQGIMRTLVRGATGIHSSVRSPLTERLTRLAERSTPSVWIRSLGSFSSLMETLRTTNVSPLLAWEQFLLTLP